MTKYEFLYKLQQGLAPMSPTERMERCAFYEELINDMTEDGCTEEEAAARLGDPEALAASILREEPEAARSGDGRTSRGWLDSLRELVQRSVEPLHRVSFQPQRYSTALDPGGVHSLDIRWGAGKVEVYPEEREDIMLIEERSGEDAPLSAAVVDGTLRISPADPGHTGLWPKALSVALPEGLARVLNLCAAETASGDILFRDLRADKVRAASRSGDVTFRGIRALEAEVSTLSGDLRLELDADRCSVRSTSGDLELRGQAVSLEAGTVSGDADVRARTDSLDMKAVSGELFFNGAARQIRIGTVSGDAELYLTDLPESAAGSTTSGDLTVTLPEGSRCRLELQSRTGDTSFSGPGIGSPEGPLFQFKSVSGDVDVRA